MGIYKQLISECKDLQLQFLSPKCLQPKTAYLQRLDNPISQAVPNRFADVLGCRCLQSPLDPDFTVLRPPSLTHLPKVAEKRW